MTKVDVIPTLSQFEKILKENTKVAVHFTLSWRWRRQCGGISRKFSEAIVTYPKIKFITVIVDENYDTAMKYYTTACAVMFKFYINGTEFSRLLFANEYELNEELKELSDSIIDTSERIDDTSISSACKNPSCNPFLSNSDHKVALLNVIDHEPVETLTTEILSSTNESPYYNPFDSNLDYKVDLLNVFINHEPVETLTTDPSSPTNESPYYIPFDSNSGHKADLLSVPIDYEPAKALPTAFSSSVCKSPSCNPFPSNSDHKVDLMNVFIDHEPVEILPTELSSSTNESSYYYQFASNSDQKADPFRNCDSRDDAYVIHHGEQEISDAPGLEWSQNLESNQITDRSNSISLKQSVYSDEFMQTDDPYISSKLLIDSIHTNASPLTGRMPHSNYYTFSSDSGHHKEDQVNNLSDYVPGKIIFTHFYEQPPSRNFRSKYDVNNTSPYKHANNGASRHISRKDTKISQQRRNTRGNTRTQPSTVPNAMNSTYCYPSTIPRTQNAHVSPHPTRIKSYYLSFCCICLFATFIVVFLIGVVIIIAYAPNF